MIKTQKPKESLSLQRYKQYLASMPPQQKENTKMFIYIALTFAALSFFGIFAINPTLSTIFKLQKELEENKQVANQLQTKIENLSSLHQQYTQIEPDIQYVYQAVPRDAQAPSMSAQVASLIKKHSLTTKSFKVGQIQLIKKKQIATKPLSYIFTLQATGSYDNMLAFATDLSKVSRVITVESMSVGRNMQDNELEVTIRGRQYYLP